MRILGSAVVCVVLAAAVWAQPASRVFTRPAVPPAEVLNRLNLKHAWHAHVGMESLRDGLLSIQLLDGQVLVQTRSGGVTLLNAETGAAIWRARVGVPYRGTQALGANAQAVFVANGDHLYALSRTTGQGLWDMLLPSAVTAPPVADETQIYLCMGAGRIVVYQLPDPKAPADQPLVAPTALPVETQLEFRPPPGTLSTLGMQSILRRYDHQRHGPRASIVWSHPFTGGRLEQAPLLTEEFVTLAATDGTFFTTSKFLNRVLYSFQAEAALSAPMGQYGETAFVPSTDYLTYSLDIVTGRILWRVLGGAPILRKPEVFDEELYVAPERVGLYRIERTTGHLLWHNFQAERFLAQNRKFVYATDHSNRLLLLDRVRGTVLTSYDGTRDFVFPVANEMSDRLFLAANNGMIVCLHDRDYPTALKMKNPGQRPAAKPAEKPAEKPKDDEPGEPVEKPAKPAPEKPVEKPAKPAPAKPAANGKAIG
jgi:outer membrane protein assembly factor BamB